MRRLLAFLGLAGAAAAAFAVVRRNRALATVASDLRNPTLLVPMSFTGPTSLKVGRRMLAQASPVREGVTTREVQIPGDGGSVRAVVYERTGRSQPSGALLWIHGGGLIMGRPESGNDLCSHVASALDVFVLSVDYRLAPEHPFPAGLDDCFAALTWLHAQASALGIDPARIAVGGDSAGGGLTATLVQMTHDRGGPAVCFQLLQYPMLDDRTALRTDAAARGAVVWSNRSNRFAWTAYLGHAPSGSEDRPYAAAARRADLSGLPPAWIGVGAIDLFYDEDADYARRLVKAGVPCEFHVVPGMYHAADVLQPTAPAMVDYRQRIIDALGAALTTR